MARPKKKSPMQNHMCDGPVGNITFSDGSNPGSVIVNAAKMKSLISVSCSYVSCGSGVKPAKLVRVDPSCDGHVRIITVSEKEKHPAENKQTLEQESRWAIQTAVKNEWSTWVFDKISCENFKRNEERLS
jgi:hypothetical protein